MKELTSDEVKEVELELVILFDELCSKNNWRYSLGGGSLLGAIRHKGFIPWDDDIDVIMPRPDYDRFILYSKENSLPFLFMTYETTAGYNNLQGKIVANNTIIKDSMIDTEKYQMGIHIDVFPIEGMGNTKEEAIKVFNKTTFRRELLNARTWKRYSRSKTHPFYYEPIRFVFFILSRFVNAESLLKSIDRENRKRKFDEMKFVGCVGGCYRKKEILPYQVLASFVRMEFEGRYLCCLKYYDEYLGSIYGKYMTLPPDNQRISHHTFKAYLLEKEDK